jgi:hypothetical protein
MTTNNPSYHDVPTIQHPPHNFVQNAQVWITHIYAMFPLLRYIYINADLGLSRPRTPVE